MQLLWSLQLKQENKLTSTFQIILKHYFIGIIVLILGVWIIGEVPRWYTVEHQLFQWIVSVVSIPLIGLFLSSRVSIRLKRTQRNMYLYSILIIFMSWIFNLYAKALAMGVLLTIENGQERILNSIFGYTIYQLWLYGGLGLIHGLLGGILLKSDLKKYITVQNCK